MVGNGVTQKDVLVANGFLCVDSNTSGCPNAEDASSSGKIFASSTSITAIDLAENYVVVDNTIEAGDMVSVGYDKSRDTENNEKFYVEKSNKPYDEKLVGVISTAPGVLLGRKIKNSRPVALSGRVPVKVSLENGPIHSGDYLTAASGTPGYAMKATKPGRVVGTALESFDGTTDTDSGFTISQTGKIAVFINPHYAMVIPESTSSTGEESEDGIFTQFTALLIGALDDLEIYIESGILKVRELVADIIRTKEIQTEKLCVGATCINEDQLKKLLENTNVEASVPSVEIMPASTSISAESSTSFSVSSTPVLESSSTVASSTLPEAQSSTILSSNEQEPVASGTPSSAIEAPVAEVPVAHTENSEEAPPEIPVSESTPAPAPEVAPTIPETVPETNEIEPQS